MSICTHLVTVALLSGMMLSSLSSAEAEPRQGKDGEESTLDKVLDSSGQEELSFPSYDERRDVYYSVASVLRVERQLAELEKQGAEDGIIAVGPTGAAVPVDPGDVKQSENYARQAVAEVESFVRSESWERAMTTAERHMNRLRGFIEAFPDNAKLSEADTMLRQYYVLAENKKLYEEARAQFEALGLRIEGIIWSAEGDQPSLAIISGEPVARGVNDRVRGTVVKNIDQNRVDFMYSYRQRRFHFQLYLEPKN